MKTKLGLLFASLCFALSLVFAPYGYGHKTSAPLVSFEDYSKMENIRDRKAALAKESPLAKSMLWRQHLAYHEGRMQLNQQQRDFLKRVSAFLDESFFATPANMSEAQYIKTERGKPFKELMSNVKTLFTPEQRKQLFLTVGDAASITDWGCAAPKIDDSDATADKMHGPNASEPDAGNSANSAFLCDCTESLCGSGCGEGWRCARGFPCPGTQCGCFGYWECDGRCERLPEYPY
jgi:hypothetical protein